MSPRNMIELAPPIDEEERAPAPVPFNYVSDLTRVRAELDWRPTVGVEEGLRYLL